MSVSPDYLIDGDYSRATPIGAKRFSYPFLQNKDRVSACFDEDNWQTIGTWQPPDLSQPYSAAMPDYYLTDESRPVNFTANLFSFTRGWCRIPATQTTYSSQPITKPNPSAFGTVQGYSADNTGVAYGPQTFLYAGYYFSQNKVYGARKASTSANNGSDTDVTCTAHGIVAGNSLLASKGTAGISEYIFATGQFSVPDANTIRLIGINLGTAIIYLAKYYRAFTPGSDQVGMQMSQAFYLPGVTTGIATAADIPIPTPLLNDLELVDSMLANLTGYQTYNSTPLILWRGQIYTQTSMKINMSDL